MLHDTKSQKLVATLNQSSQTVELGRILSNVAATKVLRHSVITDYVTPCNFSRYIMCCCKIGTQVEAEVATVALRYNQAAKYCGIYCRTLW